MNGPIPEAEAKTSNNPKTIRTTTIGISHQSLRCHKNFNNSPTTPKLDVMLRMKLFILTIPFYSSVFLIQLQSTRLLPELPQTKSYFLTTKSFTYSVSMSLFPKVFSALAGVVTIGSPRKLKLVFNKTGTPVAWPKSSMAR
jgi:hypothetical protein